MKQRRLVPVLIFVAVGVGAALWWRNDEGRHGANGFPQPGISPVADGAALSPSTAVQGEAEASGFDSRRALDGVNNGLAVDDAASAVARSAVPTLRGRVVDGDGEPIAGAVVHAADHVVRLPRSPSVSTDAAGEFRLECRAGSAYVGARAPGYVPATVEQVLVAAAAETVLGDIALERSAVQTGVVLDGDGAPLEGASITTWNPLESRSGPVLETDHDGSFRLDQLDRASLTLIVKHVDHVAHTETIDASQPLELAPLSIRLERGAAIEGRLQDMPADVAGPLEVRAIPLAEVSAIDAEPRRADVDADGSFRLGGLVPGSQWHVYALTAADVATDKEGTARISERRLVEAGVRDLVLRWEPPCTLRVRFVDARTREPIEWLAVRWESRVIGRPELDADRDAVAHYADGWLHLEGRSNLWETAYRLDVDAVGYESWTKDEIALEPGVDIDLGTIELVPATRMIITVVDASDRVVVGAEVGWTEQHATATDGATESAWRQRSPGYTPARTKRTDEDGRVAFEGPSDATVELMVAAPGFASALVNDWKLPAAGSAETVVRLAPGCSVDVLARDAEGAALGGREIEHRLFGLPLPKDGWPFKINPRASRRIADGAGRARFENLGAGKHEFRILPRADRGAIRSRDRVETSERGWKSVEVVAGTVPELVLTEEPRGVLAGRITERGRPLAGARMALFVEAEFPDSHENAAGWSRRPAGRLTDEMGRYRFEDIEPGAHVLFVMHADRAAASEHLVTVLAGETQLDLDLPVAGIAGRVVDSEGRGVAGVTVTVELASAQSQRAFRARVHGVQDPHRRLAAGASTFTDATGAFELRGVATNVAVFVSTEAAALGWQPARSAPLSVSEDEVVRDVELEIRRAGSLDLRLLRPDETPIEFAVLDVSRVVGTETKRASTWVVEGALELEGLAPGVWTLSVELDGRKEEREIEVFSDEAPRRVEWVFHE